MKRIVYLSFCLFFSMLVHSQSHYTIKYSAGLIDSSGNFQEHAPVRVLIIERNESYEFLPWQKGKITEPLGSSFREHSVYTDMARGVVFYQTDPAGYPKFLVEDTLTKIDWKIEAEMKLIAGYKCRMATGMLKGSEILVYYSEELPRGFGPFSITGLKGTILEIHSKHLPYVISVSEVTRGGLTMQKPDDGKPIPVEEYNKIVEKIAKNSYRNRGAASRKVGENNSLPSQRIQFRRY